MQNGPPLVVNFAVDDDEEEDDAVIKREGRPWRELD
jgi:hypothetical protein